MFNATAIHSESSSHSSSSSNIDIDNFTPITVKKSNPKSKFIRVDNNSKDAKTIFDVNGGYLKFDPEYSTECDYNNNCKFSYYRIDKLIYVDVLQVTCFSDYMLIEYIVLEEKKSKPIEISQSEYYSHTRK